MKLPTGDYGSALAAAVCWGQTRSVEFLIKAGADVNMRLESGKYRTAFEASQITPAKKEYSALLFHSNTHLGWRRRGAQRWNCFNVLVRLVDRADL
jgi:hypothetical protein